MLVRCGNSGGVQRRLFFLFFLFFSFLLSVQPVYHLVLFPLLIWFACFWPRTKGKERWDTEKGLDWNFLEGYVGHLGLTAPTSYQPFLVPSRSLSRAVLRKSEAGQCLGAGMAFLGGERSRRRRNGRTVSVMSRSMRRGKIMSTRTRWMAGWSFTTSGTMGELLKWGLWLPIHLDCHFPRVR